MKLVFIPGLMCTPEVWSKFSKLRKEYLFTDAYLADQHSILEMASKIASDIKDSESITVIGFSMGGYVALELATRHYSWLKKLVLINTTAASVSDESLPERKQSIELARSGNLEMINAEVAQDFYEPRQEWLELERKMFEQMGPERYVNLQTAIINRKPYLEKLANIQQPTLIISSKNDQVLPYQDSMVLFEKISNATLHLLSQTGHSSPIEKGARIESIITKFLLS